MIKTTFSTDQKRLNNQRKLLGNGFKLCHASDSYIWAYLPNKSLFQRMGNPILLVQWGFSNLNF